LFLRGRGVALLGDPFGCEILEDVPVDPERPGRQLVLPIVSVSGTETPCEPGAGNGGQPTENVSTSILTRVHWI